MRERSKNPRMYGNLEKHVTKIEAWRKKNAPGSCIDAMRQMMASMAPPKS